jgi:hypothetical protein
MVAVVVGERVAYALIRVAERVQKSKLCNTLFGNTLFPYANQKKFRKKETSGYCVESGVHPRLFFSTPFVFGR